MEFVGKCSHVAHNNNVNSNKPIFKDRKKKNENKAWLPYFEFIDDFLEGSKKILQRFAIIWKYAVRSDLKTWKKRKRLF